ncbi:MAG TPA: TetR/AcrR family transcriptional regulator [Terriglobales bacterium]|nr:TetR/AcrR family transcriptional regulator [Terriglobales bacterium]
MPRIADANLRDRILQAAFLLWHKHGEKSLTLRAVAKAAGTTTPTVYKRFPDKESLILAIAFDVRARFAELIMASRSLEDAARVYLEMAENSPHEYQLAFGPHWPQLYSLGDDQPGLLWAERKCAERYGGYAGQYSVIVRGLWMLLHGTASLLSLQPKGEIAARLRQNCLAACDKIVAKADYFRDAGR